jgi:hypothetical protein
MRHRPPADSPVDVTIVDRTNHHLFQPLLYQVATGVLSEAEIGTTDPRRAPQTAQHARPHGRGLRY